MSEISKKNNHNESAPDRLEEFQRCAKSPTYFVKKYVMPHRLAGRGLPMSGYFNSAYLATVGKLSVDDDDQDPD